MIDKGILNRIKQTNVSKDHSVSSERVDTLWKAMSKEQKKQLSHQYDVSQSTVDRTRKLGNISVKVAAALSLIGGADPYYLTGEIEENNPADENKVVQFIKDHGYEDALKFASDDAESKNTGSKNGVKGRGVKLQIAEQIPETSTPTIKEDISENNAALPANQENTFEAIGKLSGPMNDKDLSIQEFADLQMDKLSSERNKLFDEMSSEDLMQLLKTLDLQSKYSPAAKNLIGLIRLILVR